MQLTNTVKLSTTECFNIGIAPRLNTFLLIVFVDNFRKNLIKSQNFKSTKFSISWAHIDACFSWGKFLTQDCKILSHLCCFDLRTHLEYLLPDFPDLCPLTEIMWRPFVTTRQFLFRNNLVKRAVEILLKIFAGS